MKREQTFQEIMDVDMDDLEKQVKEMVKHDDAETIRSIPKLLARSSGNEIKRLFFKQLNSGNE